MKKKAFVSSIFLCGILMVFLSGCTTHRENTVRKYDEELETVFGDYEYEYQGVKKDNGYEGLFASKYKEWELYFTDAYGIEKRVTLVNNYDFEMQIQRIFEGVIERNLVTQVLDEYLDGYFYSDTDDSAEYISTFALSSGRYDLKKYNYAIADSAFILEIEYGEAWVPKENIINDYSFFNLSDRTVEDLIEDGLIEIAYMEYQPQGEQVLSYEEQQELVEYLTELTEEINEIIPVEEAEYCVNRYVTDDDGSTMIVRDSYTLDVQ